MDTLPTVENHTLSHRPNKRFEPTAQKLRFWVPYALRAQASAQARR